VRIVCGATGSEDAPVLDLKVRARRVRGGLVPGTGVSPANRRPVHVLRAAAVSPVPAVFAGEGALTPSLAQRFHLERALFAYSRYQSITQSPTMTLSNRLNNGTMNL